MNYRNQNGMMQNNSCQSRTMMQNNAGQNNCNRQESTCSCGGRCNKSWNNNCQSNNCTPKSESDSLNGMTIGMGYVPWQTWNQQYCPADGLCIGTIFPELNLPFYGCIPQGYQTGKNKRC